MLIVAPTAHDISSEIQSGLPVSGCGGAERKTFSENGYEQARQNDPIREKTTPRKKDPPGPAVMCWGRKVQKRPRIIRITPTHCCHLMTFPRIKYAMTQEKNVTEE